jgi:hypothetical protein
VIDPIVDRHLIHAPVARPHGSRSWFVSGWTRSFRHGVNPWMPCVYLPVFTLHFNPVRVRGRKGSAKIGFERPRMHKRPIALRPGVFDPRPWIDA